ncbi:MAG: hypothetical protein KAW51_00510 [Candidatus Lokiarchaeota archaeon]|nr:hypothetical protein [Candidatus Lokiarchaeota archaeon]
MNERLGIQGGHKALADFFNKHEVWEKNSRAFYFIEKGESKFFLNDISKFPIDNQTLRNKD